MVIPDAEQDRTLAAKLKAEAPGILRWAVEGCLAWQREGLGMPDEVQAATARYRADMDSLADFLRERCVVEAGASVSAGDLYGAYRTWCGTAGEQPVSQKALGLELVERGLRVWRTKRTRGWTGLRLATPLEQASPGDACDVVTDGDASAYPSRSARGGRGFPGNGVTTRHPSPDASPAEEDQTSDMFDPPGESAR